MRLSSSRVAAMGGQLHMDFRLPPIPWPPIDGTPWAPIDTIELQGEGQHSAR